MPGEAFLGAFCSPRDPARWSEVLVSGSAEGLEMLVSLLEAGVAGCLALQSDRGSLEAIFDDFVEFDQIELRPGDGAVTVSAEGGTVCFSGMPRMLADVAASIRFLYAPSGFECSASDHIHLEYWPDHSFLAQESMPLVVFLKTPPE